MIYKIKFNYKDWYVCNNSDSNDNDSMIFGNDKYYYNYLCCC